MVRTCTFPGCMRRTASASERRCDLHPIAPRPRTRAYNELARSIVASASHCFLCGQPRWPGDINPETGRRDEFVCHHIRARAHGGPSTPDNLAAAHRHCNDLETARIPNLTLPHE